eukprot:3331677-Rhodomonas_salina.1
MREDKKPRQDEGHDEGDAGPRHVIACAAPCGRMARRARRGGELGAWTDQRRRNERRSRSCRQRPQRCQRGLCVSHRALPRRARAGREA